MKRIGHTGTLDPMAEGVLPVLLGKATKLSDLMTDQTKEYQAVLLLGQETDTQDVMGTVLRERPVEVTEEEVRKAVMSFLGAYDQIPPMYSALKVDGKKLYELARAGKEVERKARRVEILAIRIEETALPRVTFTVTCSKGTYIRTLCLDIGKKLGCGGCMESLLRTRVSQFCVKDSVTLSRLEALVRDGAIDDWILPIDKAFTDLPALVMAEKFDRLVHNGNPFYRDQAKGAYRAEDGLVRVYDSGGTFIGVYQPDESKKLLKPWKVFLSGD